MRPWRTPRRQKAAPNPPFPDYGVVILPEERQDPLFRLAGKGQCLDAQLLAGLQGRQVGAFLVEVGQGQLAGAVSRPRCLRRPLSTPRLRDAPPTGKPRWLPSRAADSPAGQPAVPEVPASTGKFL